jgi:hypothetical protein
MMRHYGLIEGTARVGAIKLDLSALSLVVAVDRLLRSGGTLAFVITQAALKARAMSGLRRFRLPDGMPFGPVVAHDLSSMQLFHGASTRTACLIVRKGAEPHFPVETLKWAKAPMPGKPRLTAARLVSVPLGEEAGAPWVTMPRTLLSTLRPLFTGESTYTPREGVNTGGGSSFFWGFVRAGRAPGAVRFRNDACAGRIAAPVLDWTPLESSLLYPLVKGAGIQRWSATPSDHVILLPHTSASGRAALDGSTLGRDYPLCKALFARPEVKPYLARRRAHLRWGGNGGHSWYSLFEVGRYTFLPYKVGYRGQVSNNFAAAVFSTVETATLGRRLLIPDQTVHFIAVESAEEAHYLAGVLNSVFVRLLYRCFDNKHPSTFFVRALAIPRYQGSALHVSIAKTASKLAENVAAEVNGRKRKDPPLLDELVAQLFELKPGAVAVCQSAMGGDFRGSLTP